MGGFGGTWGTHSAVFEIIVILSLTLEMGFRYIAIHNITNHLSRMRLKTATLLFVTLLSTNLLMNVSLAGESVFSTIDLDVSKWSKQSWANGHYAETQGRIGDRDHIHINSNSGCDKQGGFWFGNWVDKKYLDGICVVNKRNAQIRFNNEVIRTIEMDEPLDIGDPDKALIAMLNFVEQNQSKLIELFVGVKGKVVTKAKAERVIEVEVVVKTDTAEANTTSENIKNLPRNGWSSLSKEIQDSFGGPNTFIINLSFDDYENEWISTSDTHVTYLADRSRKSIGQVNLNGEFHGIVKEWKWKALTDSFLIGLYLDGKKHGWHFENGTRVRPKMVEYSGGNQPTRFSVYEGVIASLGTFELSMDTMLSGNEPPFSGIVIYGGQALLYKNQVWPGIEGLVKVKNIGDWRAKGKTIEEITKFQIEVLQNWDSYQDADYFNFKE